MPSRPPIVDAHHHVWDLAARSQPFLDSAAELAPLRRSFLFQELAPQAIAAGVTATVVVQTVCEPGETPALLALAASQPLVAAVVGWTDLAAPGAASAIAELRALPGGAHLAGIRHPLLTEPDPEWLTRTDIRGGLAAAAAASLVFDLVLQPGQLPAAVHAAAALPELTFVLDHLGNVQINSQVDPAWAAALTAFANLPNTVCKLSGVLAAPRPASGDVSVGGDPVAHLRPYVDLALDRFGPDRLMFGSDWPVSTLGARYPDVVSAALLLTAGLSAAEQRAIMAGTARRVYRMPGD